MKLKIHQPTMSPATCHVWLDDHEITNGLTGLQVTFDVEDATRATLRILVDDLDVDCRTLAMLEAHVQGREEREAAQRGPFDVTTYGCETRSYVD